MLACNFILNLKVYFVVVVVVVVVVYRFTMSQSLFYSL